VTREALARVVGRDCALDLLLDDLREDLRPRPIELVRAGESFSLHTRPGFGPAIRVAFDIPADAKELTKLEAGVLMAVAMFQPVTRGDLTEMFGREISRDLIAALREEDLIAAGLRSSKLGAPYALRDDEEVFARVRVRVAARPAGHRGAEGRGTARAARRSAKETHEARRTPSRVCHCLTPFKSASSDHAPIGVETEHRTPCSVIPGQIGALSAPRCS